MKSVHSGDAEIFYQVRGAGPTVVLLHPFPVNHHFWDEASKALEHRYRLLLPDVRGHGRSQLGEGVVTMEKHAADLLRICNAEEVTRAVFAGVSMSGYILMEFWRRHRERVAALALCNTRAGADTPEARAGRERAAADVKLRGTGPFLDSSIPRLFGRTTLETRPDVVARARAWMDQTRPEAIAAVLLGMAGRPDSVPTLGTINVPVLLIAGEEDVFTPIGEAELMRSHLPKSRIEVIPRGGHYAAYEQPELAGRALRQWLEAEAGQLF